MLKENTKTYLKNYADIELPSSRAIVIGDSLTTNSTGNTASNITTTGITQNTPKTQSNLKNPITNEDIRQDYSWNPLPMTFSIEYEDPDLLDPPPLTLLINPHTMNFSLTKKITPSFARLGFVVEEWGGMQDIIKCDGKIGAYYVLNPTYSGYKGLNNFDRRKSNSFRSLYSLFILYRNNGAIFQRTSINANKIINPNPKLMQQVASKSSLSFPVEVEDANNRIFDLGNVYLEYNGIKYRGSFDEFNIEEEADRPFNLTYNFQFTVQYKISLTDFRSVSYYQDTIDEIEDTSVDTKALEALILPAIQTTSAAKKNELSLQEIEEYADVNPALVTANIITDVPVASALPPPGISIPTPGINTSLPLANLVASFEGMKKNSSGEAVAYQDQAKIWTIGYGHTGKDVGPGMIITKDQAVELLQEDLDKFSKGVDKLVTNPNLNENQRNAIISLAYNIGLGNLEDSTLLEKVNSGDLNGAAAEFTQWIKYKDKSTGKYVVSKGLVTRRVAEQQLFNAPPVSKK